MLWLFEYHVYMLICVINRFLFYLFKLSDNWHWELTRKGSVTGWRWWSLGTAQTHAHCRCQQVSLSWDPMSHLHMVWWHCRLSEHAVDISWTFFFLMHTLACVFSKAEILFYCTFLERHQTIVSVIIIYLNKCGAVHGDISFYRLLQKSDRASPQLLWEQENVHWQSECLYADTRE